LQQLQQHLQQHLQQPDSFSSSNSRRGTMARAPAGALDICQ
jgi:hypothetical protein